MEFTKLAAILALTSLTLTSESADAAPPQNLNAYRNKSRVLLIFAPSAKDARYQKQNELLSGKGSGLRERDLVRFNLLEAEKSALRTKYGVKPGQFRVLLIGKDGHTTYGSPRPVVPSDLFRRIDRMPMRRDEMRRRGR